MQNRCLKVIVVVSRAFTEDEEARTLLENAERIHAHETSRKVIPIILETCQPVGLMISHVSKIRCDFPEADKWAWPRLMKALQ